MKIMKEKETVFWTIGHKGDTRRIKESKENLIDLQNFRDAIQEIGLSRLGIGLYSFNLVLFIGAAVILYKKARQMFLAAIILLSIMAIIPLSRLTGSIIELQHAYKDAHYSFLILSKE
ncbi:hypothetical protein [Bacillus sp. SJS]|uniref:hypothetical protein n=1 Tax=Bacillus sp. SJS TaxID=1423321 RepID=UPI0012E784DC|nr:hypothetical protein [Bacillus sp. SJS]